MAIRKLVVSLEFTQSLLATAANQHYKSSMAEAEFFDSFDNSDLELDSDVDSQPGPSSPKKKKKSSEFKKYSGAATYKSRYSNLAR